MPGGSASCASGCARAAAAIDGDVDGALVEGLIARVERRLVSTEQGLRGVEAANRIAAVNGPQTGRARRCYQMNGARIAKERKALRACWAEVRELRRRIAEDNAREEDGDQTGFLCLVM